MMQENSKKNLKKRNYWFVYLMLLYPLLNFVVFYVCVNANSIIMAFQHTDTTTFRSEFVGLDNFRRMFKDLSMGTGISKYVGNSLLMFFFSLLTGMPFNMLFAYFFFIKVRGSTAWRMMIMIPAMISGLVTGMLFTKFCENALPVLFEKWFGIKTLSLLLDTRFNMPTFLLYTLFTGFSSQVIIYANAMNSVSDEMVEAAMMDGASHATILWKVCIPMIMPTIQTYMVTGVSGIFAVGGGIQYVFFQYNAPENLTTLGYYLFTITKNNKSAVLDYSYSAAVSLFFALVIAPFVFLVKWLFDKFNPMEDKL